MTSRLAAGAFLLLWVAAGSARAQANVYDRSERVAHLEEALNALQAAGAETLTSLHKYIYTVDRNRCQAPLESLKIGCLLAAARQNCEKQPRPLHANCDLVSDIMVTNRLSEKYFLSRHARFKLMKEHRDYRAALFQELQRRYAGLVTEMTMSRRYPRQTRTAAQLAAAIDGYCGDVSGRRGISWHHCAAAIAWFVGTNGQAL